MKRKEDDLTYLERVYSKILKKDPNSFLYLPLASIYYHKDNVEKAIDTLQKGLSVHSNYVTAKYYLAFLYRENGEVDKAAKMFKKVVCDSQGHYAAHKALAQYYLNKKDEKRALTELKKLARFVPPDKAKFSSCIHNQINRGEQCLKEDKRILTSAEEDTETHISAKEDEENAGKKKNVSEIITPQLKKQSEKKNDRLEGPDIIICSAKEDEEKTGKKKNVSDIITPQLKKQNEKKNDNLKSSDITICSLENWLKKIDRMFEKT